MTQFYRSIHTLAVFGIASTLTGCIGWFVDDPIIEDDSAEVDTDTGTPATDTANDTGDSADTNIVETGDSAETGCDVVIWYRDADADGFGNPAETTEDCVQPDGFVADASDCNDAEATVYPTAPERCDLLDNDCDGTIDENVSEAWYVDIDGDGFGAGEAIEVICDGESGELVDNDLDCDDAEKTTFPGADEYCDGVDNNCDSAVDEPEAIDAATWYVDADGDGFGTTESLVACEAPTGYVANASDCDDTAVNVYPGATEVCNGVDDNCDGVVPAREIDNDLDGYTECGGDCNDVAVNVYPGATEVCNGVDDDCDSSTDESDATDAATWYYDADGDLYGDASASYIACTAPLGYVTDATDCDDSETASNPGGTEVCDEVDNDCDGTIDGNTAIDAVVWSLDVDGDGYGDDTYASYTLACTQPSGYVADFSDCDDGDSAVNPGGTEVYDDSIDNDCDGTVDNSGVYCCVDMDGDGYGDPAVCVYEPTGACSDPDYVIGDGDCNDANASYYPGAYDPPYPYDEDDSDCDGAF